MTTSDGSEVKRTQKHRIFHYLRIQHFDQRYLKLTLLVTVVQSKAYKNIGSFTTLEFNILIKDISN